MAWPGQYKWREALFNQQGKLEREIQDFKVDVNLKFEKLDLKLDRVSEQATRLVTIEPLQDAKLVDHEGRICGLEGIVRNSIEGINKDLAWVTKLMWATFTVTAVAGVGALAKFVLGG